MIFLPVIILAIIQGITEFLPISSSGHLVLVHEFFGDSKTLSDLDQKRLDIAVHIGTLLAVILYFRVDFMNLVMGGIDVLRMTPKTKNAHQSLLVIASSIPVILCGFAVFMVDVTIFDSIQIMAWMTLIFGVVLYIADKKPQSKITVEQFTFKHAMVYGVMQCIALVPGVSRSGITMTAGRFMGHSRVQAARFSMMMGMVTIAAAGTLTGVSVFQDSTMNSTFLAMMGLGVVASFITAYIAILCMMTWFKGNGTMTPFVIYRILLGVCLLALIYGGVIPQDI